MNYHERRYRDSFIGIKSYGDEYPEDFPDETDEKEQLDEIEIVLGLIAQHGGEQASGVGEMLFTTNSKGIAREHLREHLEDIETAAKTLAYKIAGIDLIFRVPYNLNDAAMLALARAFVEQAPQYEAELKKRLPATFLADLQNAINDFEQSLLPAASAKMSKVEATAQLGDAVRRGSVARRILLAIMKLKLKNNPAKMRAWLSASHLERAGKGSPPAAPHNP